MSRPLVAPWHSAPSVRAGLPTTRAAWLALVLPVVDAAPSHPAVVAALAAAGYVLGRGVVARAIVRGWHEWLSRAQAAGELPERAEPLPTRRAGARPGPDAPEGATGALAGEGRL